MEDLFYNLLTKNGECWLNYLLGASYHYQLIDGAVYEDAGKHLNYCGCIDDFNSLLVDFTGVSSITEIKIRL